LAGLFIYLAPTLGVTSILKGELLEELIPLFVGVREAVIDTFPRIFGFHVQVTVVVAALPTQLAIFRPFSLNVTLPGLLTVAVIANGLLNCVEETSPSTVNDVVDVAAEMNVIVT
jgi:hypothetical protein